MLDDLAGPNGLCFSPDEKVLYIIEARAQPNRKVWAYDLGADGRLATKRLHIDAGGPGALDGMRCDEDGNLWCGWGSNGSPTANAADLDGVMVFNPAGKPIGHIRLPERCANLCFGGAKAQSLVHGEQPFAVRAVRRDARRGRLNPLQQRDRDNSENSPSGTRGATE